jgi:hypothetical protein
MDFLRMVKDHIMINQCEPYWWGMSRFARLGKGGPNIGYLRLATRRVGNLSSSAGSTLSVFAIFPTILRLA